MRISDSDIGSSYDVAYKVGHLPAYTLLETRFTLRHGPQSATFFVINLSNTRAALTVNNTSFAWVTPSLQRISTNQPRTFGLMLAERF